MKMVSKLIIIFIIMIIGTTLGYFVSIFIPFMGNENINYSECIRTTTQDNHLIELNIYITYDNPNNKSKYYMKDAIKYIIPDVVSKCSLDELKESHDMIKSIIGEDIYNNTVDQGFIVKDIYYVIEEV